VDVDDVGLDAADQARETHRPSRVREPAPTGKEVHLRTRVLELADQVRLARKEVGNVDVEIGTSRLRQGHDEPLGATGPETLDEVEDPLRHGQPSHAGACRYREVVMADLAIRAYEDADEAAVLELLAQSLGKTVDERYRAFFRWKHLENPAGRSFMWIAEVDGELAGFRAFLRWTFDGGEGAVPAVRAVDTATHPDHRGAGVFRGLTEHGLGGLRDAGIAFVFNTPNDQSRPGYLKMGWQVVGRVPVQLRARLASLPRLRGARTAAQLWSEPCSAGAAASDVLSGSGADDLATAAVPDGARALSTVRSAPFLRWRYGGFEPVASRVQLVDRSVADGAVLFRLRRRGDALECALGDVITPAGARAGGAAARGALRASGADYALAGRAGTRLAGFVTTSRLGPLLTWRGLDGTSRAPRFDLSLSDIELF
jgi:hypothetical protein